ncbi:MAG: DUF883 domain-containing protein [Phycisphaerae bacterium]|nr:DUF883 domain-containing protein [Phycisphaerae bacterium]
MEHKSSENIAEALKLLEEAATQKKDELRTLVSDKYTNLRSLILENESNLKESLTAAKDHAFEATTHAKDAGVEKAREIARDVDEGVHENPWPYIAGSAVVGVLLGYILGQGRK